MKKKDLEKIENKKEYRGFYYENEKTGDWYKSNGHRLYPEEGWSTTRHSNGFDLTHGFYVIDHLYRKILDGVTLNKNEEIAFHEKVKATNPKVQFMGAWYDFSTVLTKLPIINAWVLDAQNIHKEEMEQIEYNYGDTIDFVELIEICKNKWAGDE